MSDSSRQRKEMFQAKAAGSKSTQSRKLLEIGTNAHKEMNLEKQFQQDLHLQTIEGHEGTQNAPQNSKRKKDQTAQVMKKLLVKDLNIDPKKQHHFDLQTLIHHDQVKSMKKDALEDPFEDEIYEGRKKKHAEQGEQMTNTMSIQLGHKHKKRKLILSYQSKYKLQWDMFLLFCSIINLIIIPLDVGWNSPYQKTPGYYFLFYWFAFIFFIDIIINFRTSFLNKFGEEIFDPKEIALHYMLSIRFVADIFCISQLQLIHNLQELKILQILKVNVFSRFTEMLAQLSWREETKALLKIIWYLLLFILYIHLISCLWFYVITINEEWIPPLDFVNYKATILWSSDMLYQYLLVTYYMLACFGGNELGPRNPLECGYIVFCMVAAAIINANLFGEMSFLVTIITKKQAHFQYKVDTANTAMKNIELEEDIQSVVRDYFIFTQATLDQQEELNKFLELISPSLKIKVQRHIFLGVLKNNKVLAQVNELNIANNLNQTTVISKNGKSESQQNHVDIIKGITVKAKVKHSSFFICKKKKSAKHVEEEDQQHNDEFLQIVVQRLETLLCIPEDQVVKQDEETYDMYFIAKGEGEVAQRDERRVEHSKIAKLYEGDHFGEISMIYKCKRTATVISNNYDTIAKMQEEQFRELISEYPEYLRLLKEYILSYKDPLKEFLINSISKVDYFQKMSIEAKHDLIYEMKSKYYEKGSILFKPDDKIDFLYFVEDGCLEVFTMSEGNEFIIDRLYRGSSLNTKTFFMEDSMYVYVRCAKNCILRTLDQKALDLVKSLHEDFEKHMLSYQNLLLKQKKNYPLDYIINVPKEFQRYSMMNHPPQYFHRQNILKNVVFRKIIDIRILKKKPKLSDILRVTRTRDLSNPKVKEEVKRRLLALYDEKSNKKQEKVQDQNYEKLMGNFDRLNKVLSAQQSALENLEKRVTVLQKRRDEREKNPDLRPKHKRLALLQEQQKEEQKKKAMLEKQGSRLSKISKSSFNKKTEKKKQSNKLSNQIEDIEEEEKQVPEEQRQTARIRELDQQHMNSSDDEAKFARLNKQAGKYREKEVFGKFKSPFLQNQTEESESEEEQEQNEIKQTETEESQKEGKDGSSQDAKSEDSS